MMNSANRHATFRSQVFSIVSISVWLVILIFLFAVNYLNLATVYFTINKDGSSLRTAESILVGVCHRMPSRSFWFLEVPLGLCSRCTGLYLAALLAAIILPFSNFRRIKNCFAYSLYALVPLLIDSTLQHYSLYVGNNILRFSTGALFGYGIIALVTLYHNHLNHQLNKWR